MVKSRKNRQPRDWSKATHMRSGSAAIEGRVVFHTQEIPLETQYDKLLQHKHKQERRLKNLHKRYNLAKTPGKTTEREELERQIMYAEREHLRSQVRLNSLNKRREGQKVRGAQIDARPDKKEAERKAATDRLVKFDPSFAHKNKADARAELERLKNGEKRVTVEERRKLVPASEKDMLEYFNPVSRHEAARLQPRQRIITNGKKRKVITVYPKR